MKTARMLSTSAAAVIVVVGLVPAISGISATNFAMFFVDSPIDISDGSIHANIGSSNSWDPIARGEIYRTRSNKSDTITLQDFTNSSFPGNSHTFQQTGAWFITITSGDPNNGSTRNPEAISLCSTNGLSSACNPDSLTIDHDHKLVYIETHPDNTHPHGHNGRWGEQPSKLTFYDTRQACMQQNDKCEHVLAITIRTANSSSGFPGPRGATFACSDARNFHIIVGQ